MPSFERTWKRRCPLPNEFIAIPALPCLGLEQTLPFYQTLGFEVVQQQKAPNVYAALQRGEAHLHVFGVKGLDPTKSFSMCLIIVPEVEALHERFTEALRTLLGKVPLKGIPRITRMKPGQTRFTVVDPAGNYLLFIRRDEPNPHEQPVPTSPLLKALHAARLYRDYRNDDALAAKALDVALAKNLTAPAVERARALAARAELALALGEAEQAKRLRKELEALPLSPDERQRYSSELTAPEAFERLSSSEPKPP